MTVNLVTTTKYGIRVPTSGNAGTDLATGLKDTADDIDALVTPFSQGLFSARPVSTGGSPGKVGRRYYATDTGIEYEDLGTSWAVRWISTYKPLFTVSSLIVTDGAASVYYLGGEQALPAGAEIGSPAVPVSFPWDPLDEVGPSAAGLTGKMIVRGALMMGGDDSGSAGGLALRLVTPGPASLPASGHAATIGVSTVHNSANLANPLSGHSAVFADTEFTAPSANPLMLAVAFVNTPSAGRKMHVSASLLYRAI